MKRLLAILGLFLALTGHLAAECKIAQSTSGTVKIGPFVDDTDFKTAETALTIQKADVRVSKNGGNMAAASADQGASDAGAPHDELGVYDISYNTTDSNTVGNLRFDIKETGALHAWLTCEVYEPPATIADIHGYPKASITDVNSIGYWLKTNLDIPNSAAGGRLDYGTAQAGAANSITLAATASGTASMYRDARIVLLSGTGAGQRAIITAYNQTTKVATIICEGPRTAAGSWFINPSSDTGYIIQPRNR